MSPSSLAGRLESLLNYQTVITSLTGLPIANASLLDEATAAAEAMTMCLATSSKSASPTAKGKVFIVSENVAPQTLAVLKTRSKGFGMDVVVVKDSELEIELAQVGKDCVGIMVQYPDVNGGIKDWHSLAKVAKSHNIKVVAATDLLALTMLKPPGEWGADIVLGNSARFGVPAGYGGPHAAFFACTDALKRKMPGRLVGVSRDTRGEKAYRLALQSEFWMVYLLADGNHLTMGYQLVNSIFDEKRLLRTSVLRELGSLACARYRGLSDLCSQALLANMAAMYAVYHGPDGLRQIAGKVNAMTAVLKNVVENAGFSITNIDGHFFDTLTIDASKFGGAEAVHTQSVKKGINFRKIDEKSVGVTLDESVGLLDLTDIANVFVAVAGGKAFTPDSLSSLASESLSLTKTTMSNSIATAPAELSRQTSFLTQPVFNTHRSETEMMRYLMHLQEKDFSLVHGMIPLGSCTMKLNSTSSMTPLTWKEFGGIHPFAPVEQNQGYASVIKELEDDLSLITGFDATSLQPNSGASGEYAGLCVIKAYLESNGEGKRDICLIPVSAHGTNPASAFMAGMKVVAVKTLPDGSLDLADMRAKAEKHKDNLAAAMITYPSTFGVFEEGVREACDIVHQYGGQVYLDGANLNAQVGLTNPGTVGADVCHLNLHKTFGIPHGGGGPGIGPICVRAHLSPFLPGHPLVKCGGEKAIEAVAAAPWGSASITTISWAYIKMLGGKGLTDTAKLSLLNANYIAKRLEGHYTVKFSNKNGRVAHECLIDFAEFDKMAGLKVMDFAKRLQDYSFHRKSIPDCSKLPTQFTPVDSSYGLLAHPYGNAHRAYGKRIQGGTRQVLRCDD
jgi:glycine dehydrogenase